MNDDKGISVVLLSTDEDDRGPPLLPEKGFFCAENLRN